MPMSMPARMAWYRNAECIASRTTLLPRKENEMLLTPPLTFAPGRVGLDLARGFDESDRIVVVLLDAGGDGQDRRDRR